jgi:hypothetical protein
MEQRVTSESGCIRRSLAVAAVKAATARLLFNPLAEFRSLIAKQTVKLAST